MTVTKWNPFSELEAMLEACGRGTARRVQRGNGHEVMTTADWSPVVDIKETDKEYLIKAELPEVAKENVKVSLNEGVLVIQGERKMEKEEGEKGGKYHRVERAYGSFARSFSLPDDVQSAEIRAEHKEGMLYVHLPKQVAPPAKSIEVKVH
jgi:HSP20 family protein